MAPPKALNSSRFLAALAEGPLFGQKEFESVPFTYDQKDRP